MPVNFDFGITAQALQLRAQRATLIANNIANADTPGYKAVDLDFQQILSSTAQAQGASLPSDINSGAENISRTHPGHVQSFAGEGEGEGVGVGELMMDAGTPQYRIPSQTSLDGNSVDTQMEKAAFAENQLRYQASVQFLDDKVNGLRKALRGN